MDVSARLKEIAREAGANVNAIKKKQNLYVQEKGSSYDFVTEADTSTQTLIKARISEYFPSDRVIGEEDNLSDSDLNTILLNNPGDQRIWIVDPLDGTLNYIRGLYGTCVSIGVLQGREVIAGAVYLTDSNELCFAEKGSGAYCDCRRLRVAEHARLCDAIGATHVPVSDMNWRKHANLWNAAFSAEALNMRMFGSNIYAQTRVAAGGIDFFFELGPHAWDLAAGKLLIEEAGGVMTRMDGGPFDFGWGGVIASSAAIYPEVLRVLNQSDPDISNLR